MALWQESITLSAAGYAGGPGVHHRARLGAGRAPWRVIWAFKVAGAGSFFTGLRSATPSRPAPQPLPHNFTFSLCCRCYHTVPVANKLYSVAETVQQHSRIKLFLSLRPQTVRLCIQALYSVAATVQQQARINLFLSLRPRTVILCMCVCVWAMFPVVLRNRNEDTVARSGR